MTPTKATILSTGALDTSLTEKAAQHNILVEVAPFIATKPVSEAVLKERVLPLASRPLKVVFTSAKAVAAVAACVNGHAPGWKIFCIGHATRQQVEMAFDENAIAATAGNGVLLAKAIIAGNKTKEVVFFCGDQRRDELPDLLQEAGIAVKEIVVYNTVLTPRRISRTYDAVLFFSPSAVQSFFSEYKPDPETILFSIGPTTTATLKTFSGNRIIESDQPERGRMVELVIKSFGE